jgi:hypothetical protein
MRRGSSSLAMRRNFPELRKSERFAQLWNLANSGNDSGEAHCLAARKTDTVRLDVFSVHQPWRNLGRIRT